MPIVVLYVILGASTAALVAVGVAIYLRVRRLTKASPEKFFEAIKAELDWHHVLHTHRFPTREDAEQKELVQ